MQYCCAVSASLAGWLLSPFTAPRMLMKLELCLTCWHHPRGLLWASHHPHVCAFHSFTTKDELGKAAPQLLTPGLMGESSESFSASEDEGQREYQANDSDSDGPILYTDDDDDEEDEDEDGSGESKTFQEGGREGSPWWTEAGAFWKNKRVIRNQTPDVFFPLICLSQIRSVYLLKVRCRWQTFLKDDSTGQRGEGDSLWGQYAYLNLSKKSVNRGLFWVGQRGPFYPGTFLE